MFHPNCILTNTPSHFDPDGRLQANDRADAYVAVYEPPQSWMATVADVTRLRWRGFLGPDFVQSVIDAVLRYVGALAFCRKQAHSLRSSVPSAQFVAITSHAIPTAPVSYIPPGKDGLKTPARVPSADGEDSWSLLVALQAKRWCLAESIGPLDTRWG
jgi:ribonuclease P/MRP protein subunit RPP40